MMKHIPASERYLAAHGWLNSFHLFSFAEYFDPENIEFGVLRVFNDDFITGHSGFSDHPHNNMEIVTIMFEGELTHRDSMGNEKTIKAGEVQVMTAGTGVVHAEINKGDKPVKLYQIWLKPRELNLPPAYGQKDFSGLLKKNALTPVASGFGDAEALSISTDSMIALGELEKDQVIVRDIAANHGAFLYITDGEVAVNGQQLKKGDQARITDEQKVEIRAVTNSRFTFIEASQTKSSP